MNIHSQTGARLSIILLSSLFSIMVATDMAKAERPVSVSFLSANYEGCTGYCEKDNIDCNKNSTAHGSVAWCEKNCLNKNKMDDYQFQLGVNSCKTRKEGS